MARKKKDFEESFSKSVVLIDLINGVFDLCDDRRMGEKSKITERGIVI